MTSEGGHVGEGRDGPPAAGAGELATDVDLDELLADLSHLQRTQPMTAAATAALQLSSDTDVAAVLWSSSAAEARASAAEARASAAEGRASAAEGRAAAADQRERERERVLASEREALERERERLERRLESGGGSAANPHLRNGGDGSGDDGDDGNDGDEAAGVGAMGKGGEGAVAGTPEWVPAALAAALGRLSTPVGTEELGQHYTLCVGGGGERLASLQLRGRQMCPADAAVLSECWRSGGGGGGMGADGGVQEAALTSLDLGDNESLGAEGVAALMDAGAMALTPIATLSLDGCGLCVSRRAAGEGDGGGGGSGGGGGRTQSGGAGEMLGLRALVRALEGATHHHLTALDLSHNVLCGGEGAQLVVEGLLGGAARRSGVAAKARAGKVEGGGSGGALAPAPALGSGSPGPGLWAGLRALDVGWAALGSAGLERLARALPHAHALTALDLAGNCQPPGADGAGTEGRGGDAGVESAGDWVSLLAEAVSGPLRHFVQPF
jgi:hypothetical protein